MKTRVQVLHCEHREGTIKKGERAGESYAMDVAQCIVVGGEKPMVGELLLPKGHPMVPVGVYEVECELSVSMEKKVMPRIVALRPVQVSKAA